MRFAEMILPALQKALKEELELEKSANIVASHE